MASRKVATSSLNLLLARRNLSRFGINVLKTNQLLQPSQAVCTAGFTNFEFLRVCTQPLKCHSLIQVRWRKRKATPKDEIVDDLESDDEDQSESHQGQDKVNKAVVASLRADLVVKTCFNLARNKVEVLFYEGKLRVNDEKLKKKSEMLKIGDIIDLEQGPSPGNPEKFNLISRVELVGAHEKDQERLNLHYVKHSKLIVPKDEN
ncbi:mitochondrial transcription rescue factor 1 [Cloeon dipterum]|uniref:mitochondrial transcription rescue factor 1 n=1 Tax=Cloeon dipterum TaxID=197152 RepID=UPI0032203755